MAALTQDKIVQTRCPAPASVERLPIATGQKIYRGSKVTISTTSGRAYAAAAAANRRFAGLAESFEGPVGTGTGVTGGTEYVYVKRGPKVWAKVNVDTAIRTNAALKTVVFVADDQTVGGTDVGTAGVRVSVGMLDYFEASDKSTAWVELHNIAAANIAI